MANARRSNLFACALLGVLVGGCTAGGSGSGGSAGADTRPINLSGFPAAFKQGYIDGCDSVGAAMRRNERRYKTEAEYMQGWDDGHSVCRRR